MSFFETLNPALNEIARATVTSNQDPEQKGRIRVSYPWLGQNSSRSPSEWARICMIQASKNHGFWSLPEPGDEVLVYFDNGNLESPIILGSLYSEKNPPPKSNRTGDLNEDQQNNLRFLRTKSGHLLCFDDSSSAGGLFLEDRSGRKISLLSTDNAIEISDPSGNQIRIQDSEITLQKSGGSKITLTNDKISIDSASAIELGQGASEALIKGKTFLQFFNAHTHTVGPATSSPPVNPMQPALLSQKVKTV